MNSETIIGTETPKAAYDARDILNEWGNTAYLLLKTGKFNNFVQLTNHYLDLVEKERGERQEWIPGDVRLRSCLELAQKDLLKEELKRLDKYDVLSGPVTDHKGDHIIHAYEEVPVILKNTQSIKAYEIEVPMTDFVFVVDTQATQSGHKAESGSYRPLEAVMGTLLQNYGNDNARSDDYKAQPKVRMS